MNILAKLFGTNFNEYRLGRRVAMAKYKQEGGDHWGIVVEEIKTVSINQIEKKDKR